MITREVPTSAPRPKGVRANMKSKAKKRTLTEAQVAYLLMAPALIVMLGIVFYPVMNTLLSAFVKVESV